MTPSWTLATLLAATIAASEESAVEIKGADPTLLQDVRAIAERAARIIGARAPLSLVALRADESVRRSEARVRSERILPAEVASARGRAWSDLGFGVETDPAALALALAADLTGMGFDAEGTRLLIDPTRLVDTTNEGPGPANEETAALLLATGVAPDEPVVAHYAAHRIEDPATSGLATTDAILARAALTEGGANVVALAFLFAGAGLAGDVIDGKLGPEDAIGGRLVSDSVKSERPVIASLVDFVYFDGYVAAARLAKRLGIGRMSGEFGRRSTTRDVLHLDRQPAVAPEFSPPSFAPDLGLTVADRDALGEQGVVVWVSLLTGKDNLGLIAGDGWAGDALWRLEPAAPGTGPEGGVTLWTSRWVNEEEAKDFAYGVDRCLQARFPTDTLVDDGPGRKHLARKDKVYRIQQTGTEVIVRVASPDSDARIESPEKKKATPRRQDPRKK